MITLEEKVNEFTSQNKPVRIHLGCGTKFLEDYINTDCAYMEHDKRIIMYDMAKKFPLLDSTVDEILSVHVIEHIARHLILPIFLEWKRVLKSGSFAAIEWPDLLKAAQEIVRNPDCFWTENDELRKRTLKSVYSDNAIYPDIEMLHKWGYSAESIVRLFKTAGYSKVEIQTNLYPKSFVDSRVVAYK